MQPYSPYVPSLRLRVSSVLMLGLAFKGRPETDDLRGTLARPLIDQLRARFPGAELVGWDPIVDPAGIRSLGLTPCDTVEQAFAGTSLLVLQKSPQKSSQ